MLPSSPNKEYIVRENKELNDKNLDLLVRNNLLESSFVIHEERINNLEKLLTKYENIDKRKEINKFLNDLGMFKDRAKLHLGYLEVCFIFFTAFCYDYYEFYYFLPILCMVLTTVAFQESTLFSLQYLINEKIHTIRSCLQ